MKPTFVDQFTRPFVLDPATTALLVVDMQYASGSREHGLGRLLAQQGRLAEAAARFDRIDGLIVPNIARLLAGFRAAGAAVVYVTLGPRQPDLGDAPRHMRAWFEGTNNRPGEREQDIIDALAPLPGELVLNKTTMGAFASTGIESALRAMGVRELVVTGVSTNNCVGMTAQEAADREFGVVIVEDATGTCSDEMQQAYLTTFRRLWGRVLDTDAVLTELGMAPAARLRQS